MKFQKNSLTLDACRLMMAAAVDKATEMGVFVAVSIVDESGHPKAQERMDGAVFGPVQVAQDKAYTAAAHHRPTDEWFDLLQEIPSLAAGAPTGIDRLIVFGGGFPVRIDGDVVGGIGVSGATYQEDMAIAQEALDALARAAANA